jgi:Rrf2 family protein
MGPGGGYVLARPAGEIRAGDVLRAVDESLHLIQCLEEGQQAPCPRMAHCVTRVLWQRMVGAMVEVLDSVTLAELCAMGEDWEPQLDFGDSRGGELEVFG